MQNRLIIAGVFLLLLLAYLYLWSERPTAEPDDPLSFEPEKQAPEKPEQQAVETDKPKPKPAKPLDLKMPEKKPEFSDDGTQALQDKLPGVLKKEKGDDAGAVDIGPQFDFSAQPDGSRFGKRQWQGDRFSVESGSEIVDDVGENNEKRDRAVGVGVSVDF